MTEKAMQEKLTRKLGKVRRAWKRTAALSGLAIVCLETLGILTLAFLIDWIYQPPPAVRLGILAAVLVAVVVLMARHVVRPLVRKIPHEQLALFVEEHNDKFEGALITAAEFSLPHKAASASADAAAAEVPASFIDAVARAATERAEKLRTLSILDLGRLKKYGLAAVAVLAIYGVMCLAFPQPVGHRVSRILLPWHIGQEDVALLPPEQQPIEFLGQQLQADTRILRGSAFDLEIALSRRSDDPVVLSFRPAGDEKTPPRTLMMTEIEKLNGFRATLNDMNEDTEFWVSTGKYRSSARKITVYDPLVIQTLEIVTRYPSYLQLPDRVESLPPTAGDILAPVGSQVKLRIVTNQALTDGALTLTSGQDKSRIDLALPQVDKKAPLGPGSASATFEVKADGAYTYSLTDVNGQKVDSPASSTIRALVDGPPTLEVKWPMSTISANPLGEVTFQAEAVDDLAVAGVEVVYQRQLSSADANPPPTAPARLPLKLTRAAQKGASPFPDIAQATGRIALEDFQPPPQPEEIISYYVECTDRKGNKAVSDIGMIVVDEFENWATYSSKPPHGPTYLVMKNIREYIDAAWKLDQARPKMPPAEFTAKCKELADSMMDPQSKRLYPFYNRKKVPKDKLAHADRADKFIQSGHDALIASDSAKAVTDFRVVLAELTICKLGRFEAEMFQADFGKTGTPDAMEKDLTKMFKQIQIEVDKTPPPPGWDPKQAKAIDKLKEAAKDLMQQQADIAKKAEEIANNAGGDKPKPENANKPGDNKPDGKDKTGDKDKTNKDARDLAGKQDDVTGKTQKEAEKAKADAPNDKNVRETTGKMDDAAKAMKDASQNLREGDYDKAVAAANKAKDDLRKAADRLENIRQEKLAAAIAAAEANAGRLLKDQRELTRDTEAAADKDAKDPKKDEGQRDRDYKKLAYRQGVLHAQAQKIKKEIADLNDWAQREGKHDTAKNVEDSHKEMTRGEVDQKMSNAVVELTGKKGDAAKDEQKKAEKGLENVVSSLRKAGDSMAADLESELRRARSEAKAIDKGLEQLGAVAEKTPSTGPATTGPATQAVAKDDPSKNDPSKTGTGTDKPDPSKAAQTQPGEGDKDKTAKNTDDEESSKERGKPLSDQEKKKLAEDLTYEIERFAKHLENRTFASKPDTDYLLKAAADPNLGQALKDYEPKRNEIATVVKRVRNKLEAEYQAHLDGKRLMSAQREECPPGYRAMVNKYFEALSEAGK
ncbi:MAG: DUF4175 family protein [Phycisphaerae bacterium]